MYSERKKMCKYCKRLKQLKDLDEKHYKEIISAWRLRDKRARELINLARYFIDGICFFQPEKAQLILSCTDNKGQISMPVSVLLKEMETFYSDSCIGK